jgi:hypothetical protein
MKNTDIVYLAIDVQSNTSTIGYMNDQCEYPGHQRVEITADNLIKDSNCGKKFAGILYSLYMRCTDMQSPRKSNGTPVAMHCTILALTQMRDKFRYARLIFCTPTPVGEKMSPDHRRRVRKVERSEHRIQTVILKGL